MVAVVTSVELQPGKVEEYLEVWEQHVLPVARTFKGLIHAYVLLDREAATAMPIFVYATQADADGVVSSGQFAAVAQTLGPTLKPGTVRRSVYGVPIVVQP